MTDHPKNDKKTASTSAPVECPKWAADLLDKLHRIEVKLGNVLESTDDPKKAQKAWLTKSLGDLVAASGQTPASDGEEAGNKEPSNENPALGSLDASNDEGAADLAEAIFDRVCAGLDEDGFDAVQIAAIVNSRVGKSSRMKYCDENDVKEALEA